MRHTSFILVSVVVVFLIGAALLGAYAYDASRDDLVAEGITVAGVDVGGMRRDEASREVHRTVNVPLGEPLTVLHGGRRFRLSARDAGSRADVGGMIDEAVRRSRRGNLLSRVVRDLRGGQERARIPARITYSKRAVSRLVKRVAKGVDRPARDARVEFPSLVQVNEQNGVVVKKGPLRARLERSLSVLGADRTLEASTEVTRPRVTRAELARSYPSLIVVERGGFRLKLYRQLRLAKTYKVAVGQVGLETPAGLYHVQNKAVNPAWSVPKRSWAGSLAGKVIPGGRADNPLKARWLGIYDGAGIHGTDETASLGSAASHGCIRMAIPDVVELYKQVPVQTPVYIS